MRPVWLAIYAAVAGMAGLGFMAAAGAPKNALIVQAAALAIGGVIAWILARGRSPVSLPFALSGLGLGTILIGLPLLIGPDIEGVRRWLGLGPLLIQPAMIVLPPMMWLYARKDTLWVGRGLAMATAGLLALQPDQAGGLALATAIGTCVVFHRQTADAMVMAVALALQGWAGMGVDPLAPVPHVELAAETVFAVNRLFGIGAWIVMLGLPLPFVLYRRRNPANAVLASLWIGLVAAAVFRNYPEPIIGYSASLALGWMISLGLAARPSQEPA